jgi:hypothetical protein
MSDPIVDNHNNLHQIKERFTDILNTLDKSKIRVDVHFLNADAGFDSMKFR